MPNRVAAISKKHCPAFRPGFVNDTIRYLCEMWSIEAHNVEFNFEELYEMENYPACAHAAMVIKHSKLSDRVQAKH